MRKGSIMLAALFAAGLAATAFPAAAEESDHGLGTLISQRLRAGGSFFTADEQAVIGRACGYAPGEWDGYDIRFDDGELICTNGRRVDSPEVRRVMRAAGPRISRRVSAIMANAEVRQRIERISRDATERAMRALARHEHWRDRDED